MDFKVKTLCGVAVKTLCGAAVKTLCGAAVFAGFSVAIAGQDRAVDYTQWRGPDRDGGTASFAAPAVWPERLTQKEERATRDARAFDPTNVLDARERAIAQIVRRRATGIPKRTIAGLW